jgi:glycogen operon protein
MSKKNYPWKVKRGYPLPLGVTVLNEGINFALFARHTSQVVLVVDYKDPEQATTKRYELTLNPEENRTGDIWHVMLETSHCNLTYGYRVFGEKNTLGNVFEPQKILIDPYCHALIPRKWGETSRYGQSPCCRIIAHDFDWQNDRPLKTPLSETIIYELHVRGFTNHPDSKLESPGTYAGIIEKIPYLKQLGITAVELMPVTEFDENDNVFHDPDTGTLLKNFWGYNPLSFFALKSGYASNPDNHVNEFKAMVQALHSAGIEVILDIVFNHTGEGDYAGTTTSFRGIDNPIYYMLEPETKKYLNFSGCGNTMNCNHPIVRSLIRDSLRYWVMEMHIDGFRFDLASILGRDQEGNVLPNPPMIELIAEDPILRDTKVIAEAWDAAGLYQVGSFSTDARWGEWNGRFRDDIRSFMAGHSGMVTRLATRIAGSSDLYQASCRGPLSSINFITSHDGFTLYDLVSYDQKHNLKNGEKNRDGDNHNISWNSGHEGVPAPTAVEQLRMRRIRSMFTILMLSQGVPMITAGDEIGRTQQGNNNAWCQDNSISWLDWQLALKNHELLRFFRQCIVLRRRHSVFRREDFFYPVNPSAADAIEEIAWQYLTPGQTDWSRECHGLGVLLHGRRKDLPEDDDFFIMINGEKSRELYFIPPPLPVNTQNRRWHMVVDTSAASPYDIDLKGRLIDLRENRTFLVSPFTVMVLQSLPTRF